MPDDLHIVLHGDVIDGHTVYGPFLDFYEAREYAIERWGYDGDWLPVPITAPTAAGGSDADVSISGPETDTLK